MLYVQRKNDPEAVGKWLLSQREKYPDRSALPLSRLADEIPWYDLPEVPSTSIGSTTKAAYIAELEAREDKYAKAALRDLRKGERVKGYDDAGD